MSPHSSRTSPTTVGCSSSAMNCNGPGLHRYMYLQWCTGRTAGCWMRWRRACCPSAKNLNRVPSRPGPCKSASNCSDLSNADSVKLHDLPPCPAETPATFFNVVVEAGCSGDTVSSVGIELI